MFEHYIGVDLHQAFFQACAVTATGERAWEDRFPRTEAGIATLLARCDRRTAVAVEASTPTWHFADAVCGAVGDLKIIDPVRTKLKAGYAAKTDRLDARRLADALRRESVVGIYYPPIAIRELRELSRFRLAVVQIRTALIQRLRAVLLRQGLVDRRRLARTPSDVWLEALTLPPRAAASVAGLRRVLTAVRSEATTVDNEVQAAAAVAADSGDWPCPRLDDTRGSRRHSTLSQPRPPGQLRRLGASRGGERRSRASRPDHTSRLALVAMGLGGSGDARHAAN